MLTARFHLKNFSSFIGLGMTLLGVNLILSIFWEYFPPYELLFYAGIFLWILGIVLWFAGLSALKKYGEAEQKESNNGYEIFVDKSIFCYIRHPQYLAYMLFNIGFIFTTGDTWIVLTSILSIGFFYFGIQDEEEKLISQFGDDYKSYMKRVPGLNIFESIRTIYKK